MRSPRRKQSREFKLEAVKQVVQQGRSVSEVAQGLGINRNLLTRWKTQFEKAGAVAFPCHGRRAESDAEAEIRRLQRGKRPVHPPRQLHRVRSSSGHPQISAWRARQTTVAA